MQLRSAPHAAKKMANYSCEAKVCGVLVLRSGCFMLVKLGIFDFEQNWLQGLRAEFGGAGGGWVIQAFLTPEKLQAFYEACRRV